MPQLLLAQLGAERSAGDKSYGRGMEPSGGIRCYYCGHLLPMDQIYPEFRKVDGKTRKLPVCQRHWELTGADKVKEARAKAFRAAPLAVAGPLLLYLTQRETWMLWYVIGAIAFLAIGWAVGGIMWKRRMEAAYYIRPEHRPSHV
jgi:hypothetical protein